MYKGGSPDMCSFSPKAKQTFFLIRVHPCLSVVNISILSPLNSLSGMESYCYSFTTDFSQNHTEILNRPRRRNVLMYKGGSPAICSLSPKANQIVFLLIRVNPPLSVSQLYFSFHLFRLAFILYPFTFDLCPFSFRLCPFSVLFRVALW